LLTASELGYSGVKATTRAKALGLLRQLRSYHASLIARAEAEGPTTRWTGVRGVMFPWFVPLFVLTIAGAIFRPSAPARYWLVGTVGGISMIGALYAGGVFVVAGIRADLRRLRDRNRG
jgi:hypothetical protein